MCVTNPPAGEPVSTWYDSPACVRKSRALSQSDVGAPNNAVLQSFAVSRIGTVCWKTTNCGLTDFDSCVKIGKKARKGRPTPTKIIHFRPTLSDSQPNSTYSGRLKTSITATN